MNHEAHNPQMNHQETKIKDNKMTHTKKEKLKQPTPNYC